MMYIIKRPGKYPVEFDQAHRFVRGQLRVGKSI
jgi:hypothetical protein